jgi:hypothetical protein
MALMGNPFSAGYGEARAQFLSAAQAVGAALESFPQGQRGPDGGDLGTDVAWLGPADASRVLVTISGTHGVEGFFGSATQIEWLRRAQTSPPLHNTDTAVMHIHAINPYGFAWLRRTNEDNIDLNRNWIDFSSPVPENSLYEEIAADLCPPDWSPETQQRTGARIAAWMARHGKLGPAMFQKAVSSGQWKHPDGLFYGGTAPCWSRITLTHILQSRLARATRINVVDFHTGLGPYGYAEPIICRPRSDSRFASTRKWIGAAAKSLYGDGSVSAEIQGDGMSVMPALLPHAVVDVVGLECGILPVNAVAQALRADAWLHAHGDPRSPEAAPIKAKIREAFHSDDPLWQGMALGQGLAAAQAGLAGLHDE